MYRLLLLCLFVTASLAHRDWSKHHYCHRQHHNYHKDKHNGDYHRLSWEIVNLDRMVQRICNSNSNHLAESFFNERYHLTVNLPEYTAEDIKVKIRHRVLFVEAVKSDVNSFLEVKVLPEFVDPSDAGWVFKNDQLLIEMKYRVALGVELAKDCNLPINTTLFEVPMSYDIDARFGIDTDASSTTPVSLNENAV